MTIAYADFIARRKARATQQGPIVSPGDLHYSLKPFQVDLVIWAARIGRAAIWADTGLGKTRMQLEWARSVSDTALIVTPLAVAEQTVDEAAKIAIDARYVRSAAEVDGPGIYVTNYEMVDRFDTSVFGAVVLDESSILKQSDGKTRTKLIEAFAGVPFRLACSATPAQLQLAAGARGLPAHLQRSPVIGTRRSKTDVTNGGMDRVGAPHLVWHPGVEHPQCQDRPRERRRAPSDAATARLHRTVRPALLQPRRARIHGVRRRRLRAVCRSQERAPRARDRAEGVLLAHRLRVPPRARRAARPANVRVRGHPMIGPKVQKWLGRAAESTGREIVLLRDGGVCVRCGRVDPVFGVNHDHRKNRSQGGDWAPSNGQLLCGSGTTGCHGYFTGRPKGALEEGYAVPSWGDPAEWPARRWFKTEIGTRRLGWALLDDAGNVTEITEAESLERMKGAGW